MSLKLKPPVEVSQIQSLLETRELPDFLMSNTVYVSDHLRDFYIGFNKYDIGDPLIKSYKSIVKNITMISKGVALPVIRNQNMQVDWIYKNLPDKIVIILEVKEEYFIIDNLDQVKYFLLGVFTKEEFESQRIDLNSYDEFTSFIEEGD